MILNFIDLKNNIQVALVLLELKSAITHFLTTSIDGFAFTIRSHQRQVTERNSKISNYITVSTTADLSKISRPKWKVLHKQTLPHNSRTFANTFLEYIIFAFPNPMNIERYDIPRTLSVLVSVT